MPQIIREEETLAMKLRVHDDIGHSILAARRALLQQASLEQIAERIQHASTYSKGEIIGLVQELARQITAVATQTAVTGIINCCSGKPVSLAERVEQYIKEHHLKIELEYGAYPDRPYDSPCEYGDSTKINLILSKFNK